MTRLTLACAALLAATPINGAFADQTEPAPGPRWTAGDGSHCIALYDPVCAVKNGVRFTYSNTCYARRADARVVSPRPCGDVDRFPQDRR